MIDVIDMHCPHCKRDFVADIYFGEEPVGYDATLIRKRKQRIKWAELSSEIMNGNARALLSVGDTILVPLKSGREIPVSVADIGVYNPTEVIFAFRESFGNRRINRRNTNEGGWAKSEIAPYINEDILNILPEELVDVITPRKIIQIIDGTKYEKESKLWLFSLTEMLGIQQDYEECDFGDKQLELFKKSYNRIVCDEDGNPIYHSLRSPTISNSTYFWLVGNGGGLASYFYASAAYGVAPGFSIYNATVTQQE